jgi:hypothetical protein
MQPRLQAIALSYGRAAAAAVAALYMAGVTDPRTLANAFLAALIGPALKAIDPKSKEFGVGHK